MTRGDETLGGGDAGAGTPSAYAEPRALRVQREGLEDLLVPLYPDQAYVFGRAPECSLVFTHEAVSRQHGRLAFREDHRWVYRDLYSKNGSFLGESSQRMSPAQDWVLEAGAVVRLGDGHSRITLLESLPRETGAGPRVEQGGSPVTVQLERAIERCARHHLPVFLLGESGTGKTYTARRIHGRSEVDGHFIILSCGRLPQEPASLTSELLGYVKGYGGAPFARVGKLHGANGGTLFLDQVELLPRLAQDFLMDVLEGTGNLAPLGAPADFREPPPRFRLISASKVPLRQTSLRPDLAQRLAAGDFIILPSLHERREDIPLLVESLLRTLKAEQRYDVELTPEALEFLQRLSWPGQIRELEQTVRTVVARETASQELEGLGPQRTVITLKAVRSYLEQRELGFGGVPPVSDASLPTTLDVTGPIRKRPADLTEQDIRSALERNQGNKTRAAGELGVALNTLKARMKAFGIDG